MSTDDLAAELVAERFGERRGILREAVAKPPPLREVLDLYGQAPERRREVLLQAMPSRGGRPRRPRDFQEGRRPGSLARSRASEPSISQTTTVDDQGGWVSLPDGLTVRRPTDKTGEARP